MPNLPRFSLNKLGKVLINSADGSKWTSELIKDILPKDNEGEFIFDSRSNRSIDPDYLVLHAEQQDNLVTLTLSGKPVECIVYEFKHPVTEQKFILAQKAPIKYLPPKPEDVEAAEEEAQAEAEGLGDTKKVRQSSSVVHVALRLAGIRFNGR